MSKIDVEAFRKEGFSFEEIESVKRGLEDVENGRTISRSEMNKFIKKELFAKYSINA